MKDKINKLLKNKRFVMFMILFLILLICLILLKGAFFPKSGSNYGNRLDGIEKIKFGQSAQTKIIKSIKSNEKVEKVKMNIHGKIINIIYDVKKTTTVDEAHLIAQESLDKFSNKVKGFYDIQFIITNKNEEGQEVETTKEDGTVSKEIVKQFPIMGYKNAKNDSIVW